MRGTRTAFAVFVGSAAFLIAGVAVGPTVNEIYGAGGPGAAIAMELVVLGLAWIFALWGALVAIMVFLVLWVGASLADEGPASPVGFPADAGTTVARSTDLGIQPTTATRVAA